MKKVKGIGRWKGKDVPGMYQKGGTPKEIADSLKNIHSINTIGNAHLVPDSIKQKFDGMEKMPITKEQAIKRMTQKMAAQMNAKAKHDLKRRRR